MTPFAIFAFFGVPALLFSLGLGAVVLHERPPSDGSWTPTVFSLRKWRRRRAAGTTPHYFESDSKGSVKHSGIGTVRSFNATKGYGFILPGDGGKDVFVHITAVQAAGLKELSEGQKVSYELRFQDGKVDVTNLKPA